MTVDCEGGSHLVRLVFVTRGRSPSILSWNLLAKYVVCAQLHHFFPHQSVSDYEPAVGLLLKPQRPLEMNHQIIMYSSLRPYK